LQLAPYQFPSYPGPAFFTFRSTELLNVVNLSRICFFSIS
jgi:hypothetical protein